MKVVLNLHSIAYWSKSRTSRSFFFHYLARIIETPCPYPRCSDFVSVQAPSTRTTDSDRLGSLSESPPRSPTRTPRGRGPMRDSDPTCISSPHRPCGNGRHSSPRRRLHAPLMSSLVGAQSPPAAPRPRARPPAGVLPCRESPSLAHTRTG